mmetsp:Transcript_13527/g.34420  ORF Transcript_13527/g.34420 Transcript_13527/m.34420 type:complete len:333 (-) Transcript_13527:608-1606(-)
MWLAGGGDDSVPHPRPRVDLRSAFRANFVHGDEDVVRVDEADGEARVSRHGAVDGGLGEEAAVEGVGGVGGDGADHVGRVDVFQVRFDLVVVEVLGDFRFHPQPDVGEDRVPRGVLLGGVRGEEVHSRALRDDDDAVLLALEEVGDVPQQSALALELEGDLGDEAEVDLSRREGGLHGDVARVAAHEFDEADAVEGGGGLDFRGGDGHLGFFDGGVEAEGFVDERDVVVDGFGDADDGDFEAPFHDFFVELDGAAVGAVAADDVDVVEAVVFDGVDDHLGVVAAAGAAEEAAALVVDVGHDFFLSGEGGGVRFTVCEELIHRGRPAIVRHLP